MLELFFDVIGYDGFLLLYGGFCIGALVLLLFVFQEEIVLVKWDEETWQMFTSVYEQETKSKIITKKDE